MWIFVFVVLTILTPILLHLYIAHLSAFVRKTAHIPGPKPWPLIGNQLEFGFTPTDAFARMVQLYEDYGSTVKFSCTGKYFILTSDPRQFEVLLSCTVNIAKGIAYKYLVPWLGTGLLTSDGHKWKKHRKIITPAFHFKILEKCLDSFDKNGATLIQNLRRHVNGEAFNIHEYISLNTLDVICESALGISVNAQKSSSSEYVAAIKGMAAVFVERQFSPWLHFDNFFFKWSRAGRKQKQYLKTLHNTSLKVIKERKEELQMYDSTDDDASEHSEDGVKKRYTFLDLLLEYSRTLGNLSNENIREEVDTFMFEGHDTTASAVSFCLRLLALHPSIQDKAYDEVKMIFGKSDRNITMRDLTEMKFLECVIKESLRLFPSVPFYSRDLVKNVKFDELDLPAGTNVIFNVFCLHRNPEIFPEPEVFNPDRFLPENAQGRHPFSYAPFSAGPRNCIGQKFALMELKSTVSKILRNYRLIADENHTINLSWEFVLCSSSGIFLKIEERQ